VTVERSRHDPYLILPLTAALLLGLIGFMPGLGFIGPLGQGSTGHVGLFIGWAVGVAAALQKLRTKGFVVALLVSATLWIVTLLVWRQHYRP